MIWRFGNLAWPLLILLALVWVVLTPNPVGASLSADAQCISGTSSPSVSRQIGKYTVRLYPDSAHNCQLAVIDNDSGRKVFELSSSGLYSELIIDSDSGKQISGGEAPTLVLSSMPGIAAPVFNPTRHFTTLTELFSFPASGPQVVNLGHMGISSTETPGKPVVKSSAGSETYIEGTDYSVDYLDGVVAALADGALTAGKTVESTFSYNDPPKVEDADGSGYRYIFASLGEKFEVLKEIVNYYGVHVRRFNKNGPLYLVTRDGTLGGFLRDELLRTRDYDLALPQVILRL
jgi:hypothetical protein